MAKKKYELSIRFMGLNAIVLDGPPGDHPRRARVVPLRHGGHEATLVFPVSTYAAHSGGQAPRVIADPKGHFWGYWPLAGYRLTFARGEDDPPLKVKKMELLPELERAAKGFGRIRDDCVKKPGKEQRVQALVDLQTGRLRGDDEHVMDECWSFHPVYTSDGKCYAAEFSMAAHYTLRREDPAVELDLEPLGGEKGPKRPRSLTLKIRKGNKLALMIANNPRAGKPSHGDAFFDLSHSDWDATHPAKPRPVPVENAHCEAPSDGTLGSGPGGGIGCSPYVMFQEEDVQGDS